MYPVFTTFFNQEEYQKYCDEILLSEKFKDTTVVALVGIENQMSLGGSVKMEAIMEMRGPTKWLSNYYETDVVFEGKTYHSPEAAFQAAKTLDAIERAKFAWKDYDESKNRIEEINEGCFYIRYPRIVVKDLTIGRPADDIWRYLSRLCIIGRNVCR